ncbi:hypothetical protein D4764_15G0006440 [Takifugu flavidus]|uniref:Uncharacterized protein n=1 Tax=Takifugu flavidus TaxID=433684 RepID=A0A5C6P4V4_9TELE|nr:hypothetical protein D4764_15G0006440 [Takifugu flavidus]
MHTDCSIYCDLVSIEVIQKTPPCCLPTSLPFFLPPAFTTHSSSSSIYTIYESSDPKGCGNSSMSDIYHSITHIDHPSICISTRYHRYHDSPSMT